MNNRSKNQKEFSVKRSAKGYEIFLIAYVLIVIIPAIVLSSGDNAWINIGLGIGLLILVLFYYFDKTYDVSVSWGLRTIYTSTESERSFMNYHRTHFWKETDLILSYDIKPFMKDTIHELAVMSRLGSKMRILLLDPRSKYVPLLEKHCSMKPGEYAYYALQMQNFKVRAEQSASGEVKFATEIKYYDDVPLDNMLRAYDVLLSYGNKEATEGMAPVYSYEKGYNGYNFHEAMFEEKWNDASFSYPLEIKNEMVHNLAYFAENDPVIYKS